MGMTIPALPASFGCFEAIMRQWRGRVWVPLRGHLSVCGQKGDLECLGSRVGSFQPPLGQISDHRQAGWEGPAEQLLTSQSERPWFRGGRWPTQGHIQWVRAGSGTYPGPWLPQPAANMWLDGLKKNPSLNFQKAFLLAYDWECQQQSQTAWPWSPASPYSSCVTLGTLLASMPKVPICKMGPKIALPHRFPVRISCLVHAVLAWCLAHGKHLTNGSY